MKNKLLLSLGSSLLVFAPVMTVVACGDDAPAESQDKKDVTTAKASVITAFGAANSAWTSTMTETEWTAVQPVTTYTTLNADVLTALKVTGKTIPTLPSGVNLTYTLTKNSPATTITLTVRVAKGTESDTVAYTIAKPGANTDVADVATAKAALVATGALGAAGAWTSTMNLTEWTAIAATTTDVTFTDATYITGTLKVAGKTVPNSTALAGSTLKYAITKGGTPEVLTFTVKISKGTANDSIAYTIAKPGTPAFTQGELDTYVNTTIAYTAPTGAAANIATLTPLVTTAETVLTQTLATPLGIALGTTPSGVTVKYTFTKGAEVANQNVTFTLTIKGEYTGLNTVTRTAITITSSDTVTPAGTDQTALNTYMTTTLAATPAGTPNKTISALDAIVTATATAASFGATAISDLGITATGLSSKPADVTLTYQLVKGTAATHGNPQTYTLTITGTVSGTPNLTATKVLTITSSDNVVTQAGVDAEITAVAELFKTYFGITTGTTVSIASTKANTDRPTTAVTEQTALTETILTGMGITGAGTYPSALNGVDVKYTLALSTEATPTNTDGDTLTVTFNKATGSITGTTVTLTITVTYAA